jgi:hypothetical protein
VDRTILTAILDSTGIRDSARDVNGSVCACERDICPGSCIAI